MFIRFLYKTFKRSFKDKILIILTVAFGASLASFMLNFSLDIGDKMNQELKAYGANIQVTAKMDAIPVVMEGLNLNPLGDRAFLNEAELSKLTSIFWSNNILGYAPYLETTGELAGNKNPVRLIGTQFTSTVQLDEGKIFTSGIADMKPWWKLEGKWPEAEGDEVVIGRKLASELNLAPGKSLEIQVGSNEGSTQHRFSVVGTVDAGGDDDTAIFASLKTVQHLLGLEGKISKAEVSALTVPENELAKRAAENPSYLSEKDYEDWYCTAYSSTIAYQIEEAIHGSQAKTIRQIAQSEGVILNKIKFMMIMISLAAIASSALGISSLMTSKISERGKEIALMKAIGATDAAVNALFISEGVISGIVGGITGYGLGILLTQLLGQNLFGTVIHIKLIGFPIILLLSICITVVGSYPAIRKINHLEPVQVLQGR